MCYLEKKMFYSTINLFQDMAQTDSEYIVIYLDYKICIKI